MTSADLRSSEASDWSVGLVWGVRDQDFYLLDAVRQRLEFHQLRRAVLGLSERWNAGVTLIEKTALGYALLQDLRRTSPLRPILLPARLDKVARCKAQSARFEEGRVYLPAEAPWLGVYEAELLAFPNGRHDDQVDATSYALHYLTDWLRRVRPPARRSRESIRGERGVGRERTQLPLRSSLLRWWLRGQWSGSRMNAASSTFRPRRRSRRSENPSSRVAGQYVARCAAAIERRCLLSRRLCGRRTGACSCRLVRSAVMGTWQPAQWDVGYTSVGPFIGSAPIARCQFAFEHAGQPVPAKSRSWLQISASKV